MRMLERWNEDLSPTTKILTAFVVLTIISTTIVFVFAYGYRTNKARLKDIQESRTSSCQQTYRAFPEVFSVFLPPKDNRSLRQKTLLAKFNVKIESLIQGCESQVKSGK